MAKQTHACVLTEDAKFPVRIGLDSPLRHSMWLYCDCLTTRLRISDEHTHFEPLTRHPCACATKYGPSGETNRHFDAKLRFHTAPMAHLERLALRCAACGELAPALSALSKCTAGTVRAILEASCGQEIGADLMLVDDNSGQQLCFVLVSETRPTDLTTGALPCMWLEEGSLSPGKASRLQPGVWWPSKDPRALLRLDCRCCKPASSSSTDDASPPELDQLRAAAATAFRDLQVKSAAVFRDITLLKPTPGSPRRVFRSVELYTGLYLYLIVDQHKTFRLYEPSSSGREARLLVASPYTQRVAECIRRFVPKDGANYNCVSCTMQFVAIKGEWSPPTQCPYCANSFQVQDCHSSTL